MKQAVLALTLLLSCLRIDAASSAEFYVSPNGNDTNPGAPESPFATIARARDAAREVTTEPVTVFLGEGTHYLKQTIVFERQDTRTATAPVEYVGQDSAVISGGELLELRWTPFRNRDGDETGILRAEVPEDFTTDQFFVNGRRLPMARYPNFDPAAQYFNGSAADCLSRERAADWANPRGGIFHAMHEAHWGDMHYLILGKDADGDVNYEGGWQNNRPSKPHAEHRFVENIFEELDAPGEWFLDQRQHRLYLLPPVGIDPNNAKIEAVRLEQLFEFRGTVEQPVRFVHLRNLTLTHTARTFMKNREPLLRSDWTVWRGGAVLLDGVEDCRLRELTIRQVGSNAIFVNGYARRVDIEGCHITEAGASSISFVGQPDALRSPLFNYHQTQNLTEMDTQPGPKSEEYPAKCHVHDCLLTLNGRFEKQTAGVNICMAAEIHVSNCSIYDVPRAGINICDGAFGGHLIENCDVFDTVKETGDHGSFNSWGRDRFWHPDRNTTEVWLAMHPKMATWDAGRTVVIRNNRWRCDRGWDIDLDDGSSNFHIYNNLCLSGGIKLREGYQRLVENNVLVNNTFHPHVWYRDSGSMFRQNIVFAAYAPAGMKRESYGNQIDSNFLHVDGQKAVKPADALKTVSGADEHSLSGDSLFASPEHGNYAVRDNSPALELGFKNFPMDGFGVISPGLRELAKTPILPGSEEEIRIINRGWGQSNVLSPHKSSMKTRWWGAVVKNVQNDGEKSAAGLDSIRGVMVVQVETGSKAHALGLREHDVVLEVGDRVRDVRDFVQRMASDHPEKPFIKVWRNQSEIVLK